MPTSHLEFLVEEPSMEAFLRSWMPRHLPDSMTFDVKVFNGKPDLLIKLPQRLKAYRSWIPLDWRLIVLVDRDDDDCVKLKQELEGVCHQFGFLTKVATQDWEIATNIVIEELEAWYFGDSGAVSAAFPRVPINVSRKKIYRTPDEITGGTWEAFERLLKRAGYFHGGLQKVAAARKIGLHLNYEKNTSASCQHFISIIDSAIS